MMSVRANNLENKYIHVSSQSFKTDKEAFLYRDKLFHKHPEWRKRTSYAEKRADGWRIIIK